MGQKEKERGRFLCGLGRSGRKERTKTPSRKTSEESKRRHFETKNGKKANGHHREGGGEKANKQKPEKSGVGGAPKEKDRKKVGEKKAYFRGNKFTAKGREEGERNKVNRVD